MHLVHSVDSVLYALLLRRWSQSIEWRPKYLAAMSELCTTYT